MTRKLIRAYGGFEGPTDRDHLGNKRIDLAGNLLFSVFEQSFRKKFLSHAKARLERKQSKDDANFEFRGLGGLFDVRLITGDVKHMLATGVLNRGMLKRTGVSQTLFR